jgi:NifU-like protein involved in Fe-S cluster formation
LKIDLEGIVEDFWFIGDTAIVTTAAAAMFGESVVWLSISEILWLKEDYIKNTLGLIVTTRRKKASVLGLLATRNAIHKYKWDGIVDDFSDIFD